MRERSREGRAFGWDLWFCPVPETRPGPYVTAIAFIFTKIFFLAIFVLEIKKGTGSGRIPSTHEGLSLIHSAGKGRRG